jgi:serine-type D-Ala-D-Ala carboxypeptidase/endopeptidase (penicillin-binding protein 4)
MPASGSRRSPQALRSDKIGDERRLFLFVALFAHHMAPGEEIEQPAPTAAGKWKPGANRPRSPIMPSARLDEAAPRTTPEAPSSLMPKMPCAVPLRRDLRPYDLADAARNSRTPTATVLLLGDKMLTSRAPVAAGAPMRVKLGPMWFRVPTLALAFALALLPAAAHADAKKKVAALAPAALVLVLDENGNELVAQNAAEPFTPASVAKIVTAWLALEVLGADYRFQTRFYLDANRVLYIRGQGDPFLVSEELALLAPKLVESIGKDPITGVVVDPSHYPRDLRIPGIEDTDEAYDALNAALAVNFNTVNAVRDGNTVRSAELQTPITPLAIEQFRARGPKGRGRISLTQDPTIGPRYAGELIAAFIDRDGGKVEGAVSLGAVPQGLEPVYVHKSRNLAEILKLVLLGSNNFMANQIFLEIGAHRLGPPVSLDKSLQVTNEILAHHGIADAIHLEEGSGISRGNRFTASGLAKVLHLFEPHAGLLDAGPGARFKTGTVPGVRTLAGYTDTKSKGRMRFVIALKSNDGAMRFRLLKAIQSGL